MNDRKLARFFGKVAQLVHLGLPQPVFDISHLAKAPPEGGMSAAGVAKGFMGGIIIDPPAGGFAIGDLLWTVPPSLNWQTISAVQPVDGTRVFNPGVYTIAANFQVPGSMGLKMHFIRADAAGTIVHSAGTANDPVIVFYIPANSNGASLVAPQMIYMDRPWCIEVFALTAFADANVSSISMQILPVHLLDDGPSAS